MTEGADRTGLGQFTDGTNGSHPEQRCKMQPLAEAACAGKCVPGRLVGEAG